jgi:UDP-2-acetamido-3-amino-2,3-dideoxy-glucuronate N-acetyltransferase
MNGASVGSDCNIGGHVFIEAGASLGNNVTVKNGVSVWARVTVEDDCFLGPHCVFTNDMNPRAYIKKGPETLLPTLVKAKSTIGANATIVCGNTIGQFAFVGAGSVVVRDVDDYALVVGNPARQIGWMCECAAKLPLEVSSVVSETCVCSHCGAAFVRVSSGLARE